MNKNKIIAFLKFAIASCFVATVSGCSFISSYLPDIQEVASDAPLAEFVLGKWRSEQAFNYEGEESSYEYEIEFLDSDTVKLILLSRDGEFLDGATSQYSFVDSSTIFIDNERIEGGELWLLERDGQSLIVHRTIDNKTDRIILKRTANK